ncbi:MAG: hypothetical protein WC071_04865, partial [Victivallaceae bacterium]
LVDYIVAKELVTIKGDLVISRVNAFIEANLHRNITLEETARHVEKVAQQSHIFSGRNSVNHSSIICLKRNSKKPMNICI